MEMSNAKPLTKRATGHRRHESLDVLCPAVRSNDDVCECTLDESRQLDAEDAVNRLRIAHTLQQSASLFVHAAGYNPNPLEMSLHAGLDQQRDLESVRFDRLKPL